MSVIVTGQQLNVPDVFRVTAVAPDAQGDLAILWPGTVGQSFQVQQGPRNVLLDSGLWQDVGAPIPADRDELAATLSTTAGVSAGFFRVIQVTTQAF
ncbi:MAG: hypothetical protein HC841_08545 [Verrucomicrobiae bacterium]|nr:hypothetical protein [Verrucomicrobiae bacterium]